MAEEEKKVTAKKTATKTTAAKKTTATKATKTTKTTTAKKATTTKTVKATAAKTTEKPAVKAEKLSLIHILGQWKIYIIQQIYQSLQKLNIWKSQWLQLIL